MDRYATVSVNGEADLPVAWIRLFRRVIQDPSKLCEHSAWHLGHHDVANQRGLTEITYDSKHCVRGAGKIAELLLAELAQVNLVAPFLNSMAMMYCASPSEPDSTESVQSTSP